MPPDPSLEAAIHRWVARLESANVELHRAEVQVERVGRRRTAVRVGVGPVTEDAPATTISHADAYVAVSDAFRAVRRQLLEHGERIRAARDLKHRRVALAPRLHHRAA